MKYPKPDDRYDCSVLCDNFEEIDGRLTKLEKNGSGSGGGATIEVDSELSTESTNPVQNKVVTEKFNEVEKHVSDTVVHVTAEEKESWNKKVESSNLIGTINSVGNTDQIVMGEPITLVTAQWTSDTTEEVIKFYSNGGLEIVVSDGEIDKSDFVNSISQYKKENIVVTSQVYGTYITGGYLGDNVYYIPRDVQWNREITETSETITYNPAYLVTVESGEKISVSAIDFGNGEAGQFAVSDGKGGITWVTLENGNEVEY